MSVCNSIWLNDNSEADYIPTCEIGYLSGSSNVMMCDLVIFNLFLYLKKKTKK